MSFLEAINNKKCSLKHTSTIITFPDGRKVLDTGNKVTLLNENNYGYVVDDKPDLIPSCIIEKELYLGSQDAVDPVVVKQFQITHVLSLGIQVAMSRDITQKFLPCLDLPETNLIPIITESFHFIENCFLNQGKILIHCNAGVSRCSSIVIAYIMKREQFNYLTAYNYVKLRRNCIRPNSGFIEQLKKLENSYLHVKLSTQLE